MDESKERLVDKALLDQFEIAPYKKISVGLVLVAHRQLQTLSKQTNISIDQMDREFLIRHLCEVEITDKQKSR
jgi:hypothetical protein